MNRKGAALFIIFMSVIYFIAGMILYQFLKSDITDARTAMVCSAPTSPGDMMSCLLVGSVIPIVVITILSVVGGVITEQIK